MIQETMANKKRGTGFSLKDHLFNEDRVQYLAELFRTADDRFDAARFARDTMKQLSQLELKARIVHIAAKLECYLATDYKIATRQICDALPPPLDPTRSDDDFGDFIFAPLGEFVVRNGLAKKHLRISLKTLKELTKRFSMEDAIRAFINSYPDETLAELKKWTGDKNYHVRRLVSEGTRPMLPWSKRLSIDCTTPLPLLDELHADATRYVTRSVSNHLNDIAKTSPTLVLERLQRWRQDGRQDPVELNWMSRHALRTLVKQGDSEALQFLGFHPKPRIKVSQFNLESTRIQPGDAVEFSFVLTALRAESLMIDYIIDFVKANGTTAPKVHKIKQLNMQKGQSATVKKRHPLRAGATTFTLYPGTHHVTLQINGKAFDTRSFELLEAD